MPRPVAKRTGEKIGTTLQHLASLTVAIQIDASLDAELAQRAVDLLMELQQLLPKLFLVRPQPNAPTEK